MPGDSNETSEPPNPLQKLIEGFCSPQKMTVKPFDEDGEDDVNAKYVPDLTPQKSDVKNTEERKERSIQISTTENSSTPDPTTTNTVDKDVAKETDAVEQASHPEDDVAKNVIANRRKRGIENFIMACIFVLTTLLCLKKLGFTTSDFDLSVGGKIDSSSWIHVFDKSSIDEPVKGDSAVTMDEKSPGDIDIHKGDDIAEGKEESIGYDDSSTDETAEEL